MENPRPVCNGVNWRKGVISQHRVRPTQSSNTRLRRLYLGEAVTCNNKQYSWTFTPAVRSCVIAAHNHHRIRKYFITTLCLLLRHSHPRISSAFFLLWRNLRLLSCLLLCSSWAWGTKKASQKYKIACTQQWRRSPGAAGQLQQHQHQSRRQVSWQDDSFLAYLRKYYYYH